MNAIGLPKPGTEHGPCSDPCNHVDCAATWAQSASPCGLCGASIGFALPIRYESAGAILTHAECAEATPPGATKAGYAVRGGDTVHAIKLIGYPSSSAFCGVRVVPIGTLFTPDTGAFACRRCVARMKRRAK